MAVNWGNELKGFVDGLQIGSSILDARSQRDYREQMGSYYGQQAEQAADEHAEWMDPEVKATRLKQQRAAADAAAIQAEQARANLDAYRYEQEEYQDPANRTRRGTMDDLKLQTLQQQADTARLTLQQEELKFVELSSPQAKARREQAEQLAMEGKHAEGVQAALTTQKLINDQNEFSACRRSGTWICCATRARRSRTRCASPPSRRPSRRARILTTTWSAGASRRGRSRRRGRCQWLRRQAPSVPGLTPARCRRGPLPGLRPVQPSRLRPGHSAPTACLTSAR